ncbi:hypothetical protein [Sphingopyxis flava]|uniref:Single-stranded DNA-binding protein BPT7 domain-containing protein n=1 Tax=Sphingopyxis flava TaxID=1507287 RepID=A0A1T5BPU1_9SPHN|nr:hypothetical protein [Sphingopyxis flava]SKB49236.1 hypothetical protein SAMN06295937_100748 [Sphingopyxis flava]
MLRARNDYPLMHTPRGVAIWPALNEPDFKYKKEFGEYHARIRLEPGAPGLAELIEAAEAIRDEAYDAKVEELTRQKKGALLKQLTKADVIKPEINQEDGEETGFLVLRAAASAGGKKKDGSTFTKRPHLFNSQGRPLKNPPPIGSGSELILSVRPMDYETDGGKTIGARFELEAVQVLKAVSFGERSASDYGFSAVEDADVVEDQEGNAYGFQNQGGDADEGPDDF